MIARTREPFLEIPLNEEVEELSLLIPSWQIMALAQVAESEGLTVGQYVRRLLNSSLSARPYPPQDYLS